MKTDDLAVVRDWGNEPATKRESYAGDARVRLVDMVRKDRNWQNLVRLSWAKPQIHEPDELDVTARLRGRSFDNAMMDETEMHVELTQSGHVIARLNLATLLACAAAYLDEKGITR